MRALIVVFAADGSATAQIAGSTTMWSARKHILGKALYNGKNEKVGAIDDIIVTPERAVSHEEAIEGLPNFEYAKVIGRAAA